MKSGICTLFGGLHHHYGAGALANSLYAQGFRGMIIAGYDGPLPPWAVNIQNGNGYTDFKVANDLVIRFIPIESNIHFACYKPKFMLEVWDKHCPQAESFFYFDPDIVVTRKWQFFEEWAKTGVAVCHNTGAWYPQNHPFRHEWRKFLKIEGFEYRNRLDEYFNSGFVGVTAKDRRFIEDWQLIMERLNTTGLINLSVFGVDTTSGRAMNAFQTNDQDAFNITAMTTDCPLSSIGEEAMGFAYGGIGHVMLHALGAPKPWKKNYFKAGIKGKGPTMADKGYWKHTKAPICLYTPKQRFLKEVELIVGNILGRYI